MILVIGGAYQGKLSFARKSYPDRDVFTCSLDDPAIDLAAGIIDSLHLLALAQVRAGINTQDYLQERLPELQGKVLISDDISSGVVPVDAELREWREVVGRSLAMLAGQADEVWRVFCGIASRIK